MKDKPNSSKNIINEFHKKYKEKTDNEVMEKDILSQLQKFKKSKRKYTEMYDNDVITMAELKEKTAELNKSILELEERLEFIRNNINRSDMLKNNLEETFKDIENLISDENITNNLLNRIIQKITVNEKGEIDIYLKLLNDIGLDETVQVLNYST